MSSTIQRLLWKASLLSTIMVLLGTTVAMAGGGLDTSFSADGKRLLDFSNSWQDRLRAVAVQGDGKIVAVGYRLDPDNTDATTRNFAVARFNPGGGLDSSFSGDGKLTTDLGKLDEAHGVAIQGDDKIVVSGQKCTSGFTCDVALVRYNPGGGLDGSFSGDGKVTADFGGNDNGTFGGLAIQGGGKIVVAGYMWNSAGDYDFAVYRFNTDGSLDTSFSGDGKRNLGFGSGRHDEAHDLILDGSKIVVSGMTCNSSWTDCDFAVARLNSSGSLDTSFSGDGKQTTDFGEDDYAYSLALTPDGKYVAVGETRSATSGAMAVARYKSTGGLDGAFSGDGKRELAFGDRSIANAVIVLGSSRIVVAGATCNASYAACNFAMARFNASGSLNASFSSDGMKPVDFGGSDVATALALQISDDKYVVGGNSEDGDNIDFALARILP